MTSDKDYYVTSLYNALIVLQTVKDDEISVADVKKCPQSYRAADTLLQAIKHTIFIKKHVVYLLCFMLPFNNTEIKIQMITLC